MDDARHEALMDLAREAGFAGEQGTFVTACACRDQSAFNASLSELARGSFARFMSESGNIVTMHRGGESPRVRPRDLMRA